MIYVGLDDTDVPGSPGTNQVARAVAAAVRGGYRLQLIVRHQLLDDPRVPCTSKNGSASLLLEPAGRHDAQQLSAQITGVLRDHFQPGSDPGLCVAEGVPEEVVAFGRRCQERLVAQREARQLARRHGLLLVGLGGSEDGVIGALAAVGLAACGDDGRVVALGEHPDVTGTLDCRAVRDLGVQVRSLDAAGRVTRGRIDVGKKLRPNRRGGRVVLFVRPSAEEHADWQAVRLP